ncbi:MAG: glycosyl transferase [bacterium]
MADFHQSNVISTFHRLGDLKLSQLEEELEGLSKTRPLALVLPALFREFEGDALPNIVEELKGAAYVDQVVLVLGRAGEEEFHYAQDFLKDLPQRVNVIWVDSPRIQKVLHAMEEQELFVGEDGKGRSAWLAYGYILGKHDAPVIALHDCDILSYDRSLLARLVYPIMNRNLGYDFSKGYYARITDRMYGRVTRLFVSPIVRALIETLGHDPFLVYLDDFRYPLSGEVAMTTDLARLNRIPAGWGLEVGTLAEVFCNVSHKRVCQVDLADNYEHKHQPLSPEDPEKGLLKMAIDIARSIFHTLAAEGVVFNDGHFRSLKVAYLRNAQDAIMKFAGDAAINGLTFDRHSEGLAVETFGEGLRIGGEMFLEDPTGNAQIPNWSRVADAMPEIHEMLIEAVRHDNEGS